LNILRKYSVLCFVILTWAYVRSRGSLVTVTLLHGVQNGLVVINRGLSIAESAWLMMGVYLVLALLFVISDRQILSARIPAGDLPE
jgi:membrane protease YdiL (CAAX protease family)